MAGMRIERRTGGERFVYQGEVLPHLSLIDFWQWSGSDLVSNAMRGVLAEYIVACDLGAADGVRTEWDAYDLRTKSDIKVEVKSAAYCQSWQQTKLSNICFGIAPTLGWDANTEIRATESVRQADVYVFCVLHHRDKATLDPLNLDQWDFYVLPARVLNEHCLIQKTITLSSLLRLNPKKVAYGEIGAGIDEVTSTV